MIKIMELYTQLNGIWIHGQGRSLILSFTKKKSANVCIDN